MQTYHISRISKQRQQCSPKRFIFLFCFSSMICSKSSPRWRNLGALLILASRSTDTILNPLRIGYWKFAGILGVLRSFWWKNCCSSAHLSQNVVLQKPPFCK
ncbi:hypothetical protein R3W88_034086 [Solanum pinnatisectum]|uniref:Uncharacterized protein n=1 Tax=Solanum pinnatisectum TaxID=50273 RepID=A0AAV9JZG9_9SOLN|nr:hypothetical protein R3W88_034086 [Solanum pinnatisectum]